MLVGVGMLPEIFPLFGADHIVCMELLSRLGRDGGINLPLAGLEFGLGRLGISAGQRDKGQHGQEHQERGSSNVSHIAA